jgi:hypothetical protein
MTVECYAFEGDRVSRLVPRREAFADELIIFYFIEKCYAKVFYRQPALAFGIEDRLVGAKAEFAGAAIGDSGVHENGGAKECPVEILLFLKDVEVVAGGLRTAFVLGGKLRCIHELYTGRYFQTATTADNDESFYAGSFDGFLNGFIGGDIIFVDAGILPPRVIGAEYDVVPLHKVCQFVGIEDVTFFGGEVGVRDPEVLGVARYGGDVMATVEGFLNEVGADKSGGSENGNFHGRVFIYLFLPFEVLLEI